tara:strand:- start:71 stop:511 length:441 start_codon:yes stop_codon:yes gene_type:complete
MNEKESKKLIDELIDLELQKSKIKYSFFSKLTPIIIGFLGLLVSLKGEDNQTKLSELFFFLTILQLGLCVLCSVAVLYSELHYANQTILDYKEKATNYIRGKSESKSIYVTTKVSKFYSFVEKLTIAFLILSILCLIIYSYVLNFC